MKRLFLKNIVVVIIVSIVISSCRSLRAVNDFSSASASSLSKFEEIPNSFTQHCLDGCVFENIRKFEITRTTHCNCSIYQKADSVTLLIYLSIRGYFEGLKAISDNDLTSYKLDSLSASLTEGTFGNIEIDQQQAGAYTVITNILLNTVAESYRKNKIKEYVAKANQPIQLLLHKFRFILQKNLEGELNFRKEKLYAFYHELLLNNTLSDYEKEKAATDYYEALSKINEQQQRIDLFANSLNSIAKGHQKIYDNRSKMTGKELRNSLIIYQSEIRNSISQFNKLKN